VTLDAGDRCLLARSGRRPVSRSVTSLPARARPAVRRRVQTVRVRRGDHACPTQSAVERIIAWTATCNGRRIRLRYLGTAKNNAWLHTRCAAINLRTLLRHGLTRRDGAWVLA
jgi:hypothetical protein